MALQITILDSASSTATGQNSQSIITGTPTAGSVQAVSTNGTNALSVQLTGSWSGTIVFEGSPDGGTTYTAVDAVLQGVDQIVQSVTGNCIAKVNASGNSQIRLRATAAISGAANVAFLGGTVGDITHNIPLSSKSGLQYIQVTPAITSGSAYTALNVVGGIQTITGAVRRPNGYGTLETLVLLDAGKASSAMQVHFFKANPSRGTYADKGAITVNPLDTANYLGSVTWTAGAYIPFGTTTALNTVTGIGLPIQGDSSGNVYAIPVTLGTPTWTNTNQLTFGYGITQG